MVVCKQDLTLSHCRTSVVVNTWRGINQRLKSLPLATFSPCYMFQNPTISQNETCKLILNNDHKLLSHRTIRNLYIYSLNLTFRLNHLNLLVVCTVCYAVVSYVFCLLYLTVCYAAVSYVLSHKY